MFYEERPKIVEAHRYDGTNADFLRKWSNGKVIESPVLEPSEDNPKGQYLQINCLGGLMVGNIGDYIVRGVYGEYYSCNPDVFEKTYSEIDAAPLMSNNKQVGLSFSQAFELIREHCGAYMRLPHWKEDVKIKVCHPYHGSTMTAPYLFVESRYGKVPWKETMIELFSREWEVYLPMCGQSK